jgi:hypothetical protein
MRCNDVICMPTGSIDICVWRDVERSNYRTKAIYSRELLYKWNLFQRATLSRRGAEHRRKRFIVTSVVHYNCR